MIAKNPRSGSSRPIGNSVTVSQGTRSRFFLRDSYRSPYELTTEIGSTFEPSHQIRNNGNSATLRYQPSSDMPEISATLNPKRVSVATSTFWEGHPDMAHLVNTIGMEHLRMRKEESEPDKRRQSLWGNGAAMANWGWGDPPALKKGILLQQKEKHFLARWKERYCILTRDYLHCFRRTTSIHRSGVRLSEMGNFIFKLRLADIEDIQLEKRRVGTVISILLPNEPKILFKVIGDESECTQQWFTLLQECLYTSKERRHALRTLHSSGTEALRTQNRHSLSEGSPTSTNSSSSSSPDPEKDREIPTAYDQPTNISKVVDGVVLRRELTRDLSQARDLMRQEFSNRHSMSIAAEEFPGSSEEFEMGPSGNGSSRRPESWAPQATVIYKTPTLVPSASWLSENQRRSIAGPTPYAAPTFSRASNLYSTSRHTSEITFRKMN